MYQADRLHKPCYQALSFDQHMNSVSGAIGIGIGIGIPNRLVNLGTEIFNIQCTLYSLCTVYI